MSNSRFNLFLGILWFPLWGYHAWAWLWKRHWYLDAFVELLLLFPFGIAWLSDGIAHWKTPGVNTWNSPGGTWQDALIYAAGFGGLLTLGLALLQWGFQDPDMGWLGMIVSAMALLHLVRRWPYHRLYNSGSQGQRGGSQHGHP